MFLIEANRNYCYILNQICIFRSAGKDTMKDPPSLILTKQKILVRMYVAMNPDMGRRAAVKIRARDEVAIVCQYRSTSNAPHATAPTHPKTPHTCAMHLKHLDITHNMKLSD